MSGELRADWLCDDKALGFEGRHIARRKFTFTHELSTRNILDDVYKKIPTSVTTKLRNPHIDQVFDWRFGRCAHFLETNFVPQMTQKEDSLESMDKRTFCVISPQEEDIRQNPIGRR